MSTRGTINVLGVECIADPHTRGVWEFSDAEREVDVVRLCERDGRERWTVTFTNGAEDGPFVGICSGRGPTLEAAIADLVAQQRELVRRIVALDPTVRAGDATISKQALEAIHQVACR